MVFLIVGLFMYLGGFVLLLASDKVASKTPGIGKIISPYKRYYLVMDKTLIERSLWYGFWPCVYLHEVCFESTFLRASEFSPSPVP